MSLTVPIKEVNKKGEREKQQKESHQHTQISEAVAEGLLAVAGLVCNL